MATYYDKRNVWFDADGGQEMLLCVINAVDECGKGLINGDTQGKLTDLQLRVKAGGPPVKVRKEKATAPSIALITAIARPGSTKSADHGKGLSFRQPGSR